MDCAVGTACFTLLEAFEEADTTLEVVAGLVFSPEREVDAPDEVAEMLDVWIKTDVEPTSEATMVENGNGSREVVPFVLQQLLPPASLPSSPAQHQLLVPQRLTSVWPENCAIVQMSQLQGSQDLTCFCLLGISYSCRRTIDSSRNSGLCMSLGRKTLCHAGGRGHYQGNPIPNHSRY